MKSEILHFKVSSGLKNIIGKEMITNNRVAIYELVKNAYDAKASHVEVIFDIDNDRIIIEDNGIGMNKYDIENKWLFVAYSEKKDNNTRTYAGSKGIGRFSCDRLGNELILETVKNDRIKRTLCIEWDKFEKDSTDQFENLDVLYEEEQSSELQGTRLIISGLRREDSWDEDQLSKMSTALERLLNPFSVTEDFTITITTPKYPNNRALNRKIENQLTTVLRNKAISIEVDIAEELINVKLCQENDIIYHITFKNDTILDNVRFEIFYLNTKAKNNFFRKMRERSVNYGSIFLFRNGFRIYPFGEVGFDYFNLDKRKGQGYNRYLGTREIIGGITIVDKYNHFIEVSSRDSGFVRNKFTDELTEVYMSLVHRPLEDYMQLSRFGELDEESFSDEFSEEVIDKLLKRFRNKKEYEEIKRYNSLNDSSVIVNALPLERRIDLLSKPDVDPEIKAKVTKGLDETLKAYQEESQHTKKQIAQLNREKLSIEKAATMQKKLFNSQMNYDRSGLFVHEFSKISDKLKEQINILFTKYKDTPELLEVAVALKREAQKLATINNVIFKTELETESNIEEDIRNYIISYFDMKELREKVEYIQDGGEFYKCEFNAFSIAVVLDNIIENGIKHFRNQRYFKIKFLKDDDKGEVSVHFITPTGNIPNENLLSIFDLGFTTRADGTGMGLYIVKNELSANGWNVRAENRRDNEFVIIMWRSTR